MPSPYLTTVSIQLQNMPHRSDNSNWRNTPFGTFFEGWLFRQEHYLDELLCAQTTCDEQQQQREDDLKDLISRVLSHYQQYFEAKSVIAHDDVFLVLSPTWFSSFERTFLWIAGFKPSLAFRLVDKSVRDLSEEQLQLMERVREETRTVEKQLEDEMAIVQESVAASPLLEMERRAGRLVNGEIGEVDSVLKTLRCSMEMLVERADSLRATTTRKIIEKILSPVQSIRLLVAAAQLQLKIRAWGLQKDAEAYTS